MVALPTVVALLVVPVHWQRQALGGLLLLRHRRINLTQELFIGKVLQYNGICRAFCVTDAVSLAENRIHPGLSALRRITKRYRIIRTGRNACPARHTIVVSHLADGTRGDDRIF